MKSDPFAALSDAHRATMRQALAAAFGSDRVDKIAPVGGGASGAYPFKVDVADRRYLLRLEGVASPLRNPHQYDALRIAAAAGIAPHVHCIDEATRVVIMDFIEERPLSAFPGGAPALAESVGVLLSRVQAATLFPHYVKYPEIVSRLWRWVCQTGLFAPGVLDPCTERLALICKTYEWDVAQSVSSHNDPVPRNILFDGQRLWLIDWESAYRNDPFVDVAIALDNFANTPELEEVLLSAWLGSKPGASFSGRLYRVRALTRLYYAGVLLSASARLSGPLRDRDLSAPTLAEFRRSLESGEIGAGSPEAKHRLGKMFLASFMSGEAAPGLDGAV